MAKTNVEKVAAGAANAASKALKGKKKGVDRALTSGLKSMVDLFFRRKSDLEAIYGVSGSISREHIKGWVIQALSNASEDDAAAMFHNITVDMNNPNAPQQRVTASKIKAFFNKADLPEEKIVQDVNVGGGKVPPGTAAEAHARTAAAKAQEEARAFGSEANALEASGESRTRKASQKFAGREPNIPGTQTPREPSTAKPKAPRVKKPAVAKVAAAVEAPIELQDIVEEVETPTTPKGPTKVPAAERRSIQLKELMKKGGLSIEGRTLEVQNRAFQSFLTEIEAKGVSGPTLKRMQDLGPNIMHMDSKGLDAVRKVFLSDPGEAKVVKTAWTSARKGFESFLGKTKPGGKVVQVQFRKMLQMLSTELGGTAEGKAMVSTLRSMGAETVAKFGLGETISSIELESAAARGWGRPLSKFVLSAEDVLSGTKSATPAMTETIRTMAAEFSGIEYRGPKEVEGLRAQINKATQKVAGKEVFGVSPGRQIAGKGMAPGMRKALAKAGVRGAGGLAGIVGKAGLWPVGLAMEAWSLQDMFIQRKKRARAIYEQGILADGTRISSSSELEARVRNMERFEAQKGTLQSRSPQLYQRVMEAAQNYGNQPTGLTQSETSIGGRPQAQRSPEEVNQILQAVMGG